jgi:hypothetical protein
MDEYRFRDGSEWLVMSTRLARLDTGDAYDGPGEEALCPEILRLAGRVEELEAENALLRRERALLVDLEKARAGIINGLLHGAVQASLVEDVGRLNAEIAAVHLEASGGIERPPGSACACILCQEEIQVRQEVQLAWGPGQERWSDMCSACGEERETFESRCHDCISAHRRGERG